MVGSKIIVLGTAQDAGIPQLACFCGNCQRARREAGFQRGGASLALVDGSGDGFYLIDAGLDIRKQIDFILENHISGSIESLKGVFITHAHIGHIWGLCLLGPDWRVRSCCRVGAAE